MSCALALLFLGGTAAAGYASGKWSDSKPHAVHVTLAVASVSMYPLNVVVCVCDDHYQIKIPEMVDPLVN